MFITFESAIENYQMTIDEINHIDIQFDIVCEANTEDINDKSNKNDSFIKNLEKAIIELIRVALAKLDTFKQKLKNSFQNFMMTNDGFEKQLRIAETKKVPLNAVRLITYTYNDKILEVVLKKFMPIVNNCINKFELNSDQDIEKSLSSKDFISLDKENLNTQLLAMLGAKKEDTKFPLFYQTLKKNFRGEKKERIIKKSEVSNYRKYISNVNTLNANLTNIQLDIAKKMSLVESKIKAKIKNPNISSKVKTELKKRLSNLVSIYDAFSSFLEVYYTLKIEQVLNARVVLKRFYQI